MVDELTVVPEDEDAAWEIELLETLEEEVDILNPTLGDDTFAIVGTPPLPAKICSIFSGATLLKTVGASEICLLSRS